MIPCQYSYFYPSIEQYLSFYNNLPSYCYDQSLNSLCCPESQMGLRQPNDNKQQKRQNTGIAEDAEQLQNSSDSDKGLNGVRRVKMGAQNKRGVNTSKQLESAKKNSESNIVNQLFSFYSNAQNCSQVLGEALRKMGKNVIQAQKISPIFYNIIRCISSQRGKKYVNKKTLLNFCNPKGIEKEIPGVKNKLDQIDFISIQEICAIFRRCCLHYLRNQCVLSIIDSKRISSKSKIQHLKRRRIIFSALRQKINDEKMI